MNAPTEQELNAIKSGARLAALTQHSEWEELERLIDYLYELNIKKLIEQENPTARGYVQCLDELMRLIYRDIKHSRDCAAKVSEYYKRNARGAK